MASVNKVTLIGNLGRDPELRYMPNGNAVANISLATTRNWNDKRSGERQEETEWHRVVFYERLAEVAGEYLKKGRSCYVEGRLKTRKWTDRDGVEKHTTEVIAEGLQLLGVREGGSEGARGHEDGREEPDDRPARRSAYSRGRGEPAPAQAAYRREPPPHSGTGFDDMDDDIPF